MNRVDSMAQALRTHDGALTHAELDAEVVSCAAALRESGVRTLATLLDNSAAWVIADRAAARAGIVHVPLPAFFTPAQMQHAIGAAGVDALLVDPAFAPRWPAAPSTALQVGRATLPLLHIPGVAVPMPPGTAKITFTSGTTGAPKGVCLTRASMDAVAAGLAQALAPLGLRRHLCALPLAVLLEDVAGVQAPLADGGACVVLPLAQVGLTGSSLFDPGRLQAAVEAHEPDSLILLPQMLAAWTAWLQAHGQDAPASLRFVAVGGASVGERRLAAARARGIPAYEGYGLSEGASVQALNLPGADRPGSAGRALPHARIRIAADGEVEVAGSLFAGYLGDAGPVAAWWRTGDLGTLDADGFLSVQGRRKNVLITAFGRNVSPEWVEGALREEGAIAQAVVFGNDRPSLSAVLWPSPGRSDGEVQACVDAANARLPDYARVARWVRASAPFSPASGFATANGRPQRPAILAAHPGVLADPLHVLQGDSMSFYQRLQAGTADARAGLMSAPIIQGCLRGEVSVPSYVAFLTEAYHHVRHTVPLLRACRAALPPRHAWLREPLDEYVQEEAGHDEWILDDLRACGADADAVRRGRPAIATEVMVAYAYDGIARRNPLSLFGMVHVLEGTSVSLALLAADRIQQPLGLPDSAFRYLRSHGTLDREHVSHFEQLMDGIGDPGDQDDIVHAARVFYRLYGDVFRSLPLPLPLPLPRAQEVAA